jgi:hypothetical protein
MSINRTIFPGFVNVPELENTTIGYSNDASLLALSTVSTTARKKLNNAFFIERLWQQHPWLAESKEKRFVELFKNHPTRCGRILSGAFVKGSLKISFSFFIDEAPKICKLKQAEKQLYQSQNKEICGAYYKDPKSLIHQASEKMKAAKQQPRLIVGGRPEDAAAIARVEAMHSMAELDLIFGLTFSQPNHYFPNGKIAGWLIDGTDAEIAPLKKEGLSDYLHYFKLALWGQAWLLSQGTPVPAVLLACPDFVELVKQVENDEEYQIWKRHVVEARNCIDDYEVLEKKRRLCEEKIESADKVLSLLTPVVSKPSHLTELKMMWPQFCSSHYSSELVDLENRKKAVETDLKGYKEELKNLQKALSTGTIDKGYCESRIANSNSCINASNSFSVSIDNRINFIYFSVLKKKVDPAQQNYLQFFIRYQTALKEEFEAELPRDKAGSQASILAGCLPLIQSAIEGKNPSSALLKQIYSSIGLLEREHRVTIWGTLYHRYGKGSKDPKWSENNFHKFLPELKDLATSVFNGLSAASKPQ